MARSSDSKTCPRLSPRTLAYTVEIESYRARVGGAEELTPVSIRVTTTFRREDGVWKVVHRHADPITTQRPPESVVQTN
jgi:ketosteroid isomerase-like protein